MNLEYCSTRLLCLTCCFALAGATQTLGQHAPYGAGSATISGTMLDIDGTALNDHCSIATISDNRFRIVLNGKARILPAAGVTEIHFSGEEGNDYLTNRTDHMIVAFGGPGEDFLKTTKGMALFYGGVGNDILIGGPNDDLLCGGSDDDTIIGNAGNDNISGDAGSGGGGGGGGEGGSADVDAQIVGTDAFAKGDFVQIGVNERGSFGASTAGIPAGYVDTPADGSDGSNRLFGFIADTGMDGYEGNDYDGDFFVPGTSEEGFGVEIDGTNYNNNTRSTSDFDIPGSITSVSTGTTGDIIWNGSIEQLNIQRKISVYENGLFICIEVKLTNTSDAPLNNIYYHNNVDPDNDQTRHGDYSTLNTIVSQGDLSADNLSLVTAEQDATGAGVSGGTEETGSAVSLVSFDPRARVSFGGFSNRNASDIYNGTGGLTGTVGATQESDIAISLGFDVGTLDAGQTKTFVYYYSLDPTGINVDDIINIENACADEGVPGHDLVYGNSGNDFIETHEGNDIAYGASGNDNIRTGDGNDRAYGSSGNDDLRTGKGDDKAYGGSGNDIIITEGGNDIAYGMSGNDWMWGGGGNDYVHGGTGNDRLWGQGGNDELLGSSGEDTLRGDAGDDILKGGPDLDDLNGGPGDDILIQ